MTIYLASDHRGFELKAKIAQWLAEWGYQARDMGPAEYSPQDDYPDFISPAARRVSENPTLDRAIILGMTGQGEAMVANRFKGVRAAVFYGGRDDIIKLSREHNDANVLSLAAGFVDEHTAREMIRLWLETPFSGEERHQRRNEKIDTLTEHA